MKVSAIVLAAGKSTRMRSALPKVLHQVAGKAMLSHVISAAQAAEIKQTLVVYGHGGEQVKALLADQNVQLAEQKEQLGTGHAVMQAMAQVQGDIVLVLYGDVPLIQPQTLQQLLGLVTSEQMALLTLTMENPQGYGRIVRNANNDAVAIVEQKDATPEQLAIQEINTGILACRRELLEEVLPALSNNNAQGEYYLTDVIAMAVQRGVKVATH